MKTTKCGFYGFNPFRTKVSELLCLCMLSSIAEAKYKLAEIPKRNLVDVGPQ